MARLIPRKDGSVMNRFALLALLGLLCVPANAQFSAAVQGSILDPSQASVPDAKVTLTNAGTGIKVETRTSSSGF